MYVALMPLSETRYEPKEALWVHDFGSMEEALVVALGHLDAAPTDHRIPEMTNMSGLHEIFSPTRNRTYVLVPFPTVAEFLAREWPDAVLASTSDLMGADRP